MDVIVYVQAHRPELLNNRHVCRLQPSAMSVHRSSPCTQRQTPSVHGLQSCSQLTVSHPHLDPHRSNGGLRPSHPFSVGVSRPFEAFALAWYFVRRCGESTGLSAIIAIMRLLLCRGSPHHVHPNSAYAKPQQLNVCAWTDSNGGECAVCVVSINPHFSRGKGVRRHVQACHT